TGGSGIRIGSLGQQLLHQLEIASPARRCAAAHFRRDPTRTISEWPTIRSKMSNASQNAILASLTRRFAEMRPTVDWCKHPANLAINRGREILTGSAGQWWLEIG